MLVLGVCVHVHECAPFLRKGCWGPPTLPALPAASPSLPRQQSASMMGPVQWGRGTSSASDTICSPWPAALTLVWKSGVC